VGGLVAKQACLEAISARAARFSKRFGRFHHRLRGILFLATPHRGSRRDWHTLLENFPRGSPTEHEFEMLDDVNKHFAEECENIPVVSFCETRRVRISGKKTHLVKERQATLGSPNERFDHLDSNHRDMCKYKSPEAPNYQLVRESLAKLLSDATAKRDTQSTVYGYFESLICDWASTA
jgi:hypothetical protein